jgi:nodulation protein A
VTGTADVSRVVEWVHTWEDDLVDDDHAALGALLARCFPRSFTPFGPGRSWSSARPELRLVGCAAGRPVAHLAVLRRFLQVGSGADAVPVLVGDVGLVAVDPDARGSGLGAVLLGRCRAVLDELELPFGYLTCGEHVAGFYATGGWQRVPGPTRMVRADGRVQVYGGVSMVLPVRRGIEAWPPGRVDRNGWEV